MRIVLTLIVALALGYAALLGIMWLWQERLLFHPVRLSPDFRFDKPGVVERSVEVDGARLSALHFRQPDAIGLIFFLHGNAGNLDLWLPSTEFYQRVGYDLFMIDYRGFGKSSGRIESEAQLHADVLAAWNSIAPEYAGRPIVIYGRSLGTGLAARLATRVETPLVVLVSPYTSFIQLGREHFAWVPRALTRYPMRTDQWITQSRAPLFLIHGARDELVRPAHAQALKVLRPDAELLILPEAGHNDVHAPDGYRDALAARLARVEN